MLGALSCDIRGGGVGTRGPEGMPLANPHSKNQVSSPPPFTKQGSARGRIKQGGRVTEEEKNVKSHPGITSGLGKAVAEGQEGPGGVGGTRERTGGTGTLHRCRGAPGGLWTEGLIKRSSAHSPGSGLASSTDVGQREGVAGGGSVAFVYLVNQ